jgi:hypothetical protein
MNSPRARVLSKKLFAGLALIVTLLFGAKSYAALAETTTAPTTCTGLCKQDWTTLINVGAGLPALSIRLDGNLGFANAVAPVELGLNLLQYVYTPTVANAAAGTHKLSFLRVAIGLTVSKDPSTSNITFGGYLEPLGMQVDAFAFGVGLGYAATGAVGNTRQNWSVLLPFSYNISLGN